MHRDIISMAAEIKATLDKYFKNIEENYVQSQAILLDPRFKKYGFSSNNKFETCKVSLGRKLQEINVQNMSNEPVEELPTTSTVQSSTSIWKQFDEQVQGRTGQGGEGAIASRALDHVILVKIIYNT
ncbi:unnamed protein product [Macrosiphum euphorbiae]|nr:unnamed protein product [Macrosiphum euphorbiae]